MANTMIEGRRADSTRRRQRVIKALNVIGKRGGEAGVSAIARAAGVDRSFSYRHDIDQLRRQITTLGQQAIELRSQLEERDQELDVARAANRELFAGMNKRR